MIEVGNLWIPWKTSWQYIATFVWFHYRLLQKKKNWSNCSRIFTKISSNGSKYTIMIIVDNYHQFSCEVIHHVHILGVTNPLPAHVTVLLHYHEFCEKNVVIWQAFWKNCQIAAWQLRIIQITPNFCLQWISKEWLIDHVIHLQLRKK